MLIDAETLALISAPIIGALGDPSERGVLK